MPREHLIRCRAKISDKCFDGFPTRRQFGEDLPLSEDGTFDGTTIVCDPCYVAVGAPPNRVLAQVVRAAQMAAGGPDAA
jgi:hypothetical protein